MSRVISGERMAASVCTFAVDLREIQRLPLSPAGRCLCGLDREYTKICFLLAYDRRRLCQLVHGGVHVPEIIRVGSE